MHGINDQTLQAVLKARRPPSDDHVITASIVGVSMEQQDKGQPQTTREPSVPTYGLLHITQAYNRKEISFNEWLKLSREWAERILLLDKKEERDGPRISR